VGFGWYVQLAGAGNEIVGTIGGLLLGLTWLWLVSVVLLLGAEINDIIARRSGVVSEPGDLTTRIFRAGRRRILSRRHRHADRAPDQDTDQNPDPTHRPADDPAIMTERR